ncbi:MAG: hypothetical protein FWG21_01710 [Oscillospiraceae bacterium]|nr:hypothetical protein [Oscillospiraceae bacterium]
MRKILSSILVVLLLVTLFAGCYRDADVLVVDGYPIYPGLYLYFQLQSISMASQKFDDEFVGKELYEQTIDGISARDWIMNKTVELAQEFVFIEKSFERLELDESGVEFEMAYYDATLRSEWSNMSYFYTKNGVGYETFRKAYANYLKSNYLFSALYIAEDGEEEVPEQEIKDEFTENYTYLDYIRINKVDEDGELLTETKIQKARDDINAMKKIAEETVAEEGVLFYYPENIGLQAAFEYYCESNSLTEDEAAEAKSKNFTEHTIIKTNSTLYDEEFITQLFKAKYDKFVVYEDDETVYLYCRRSMLDFNEDSWKDYRESIIAELRTDTYLDYLVERSHQLPVSEKASARRYFNMNKASL